MENNDGNNGANANNNPNPEVSREELIKQLSIVDLSINSLIIVLIAIYLNIEFLQVQRMRILDQLNNTKLSESLPDVSEIPKISNKLFIFTTTIFLFINYDAFQSALQGDISPREEIKAFKPVLSTTLVLLATLITSSNLEV